MNFEDFKLEFDANLAALSDEELRAKLESVGCVFETLPEDTSPSDKDRTV